ncbi:broad specificity polyphosphatase/5'/3'-nucleotidase SurE [Alkalibacillus flavidus]|uniref:Broad specificity polyphosphatase/5'/3'-nucleotidase SurE n=1 Tax=Alkalibacillus flavidus TaxID=546021 RepID=A0ABV2KV47_9BACI
MYKIIILIVIAVILLILCTWYLFTYRPIPNIEINQINSGSVYNYEKETSKKITKAQSRRIAEQISKEIPKRPSTSYWNYFEYRTSNNYTHQLELLDQDGDLIYRYQINLEEEARFAVLEEGDVNFWEENPFPLTDFRFKEILDTN